MSLFIDEYSVMYLESRFPNTRDDYYIESVDHMGRLNEVYTKEITNLIKALRDYRQSKPRDDKEAKVFSKKFVNTCKSSERKMFMSALGRGMAKGVDNTAKPNNDLIKKANELHNKYIHDSNSILSDIRRDNIDPKIKEIKIRDIEYINKGENKAFNRIINVFKADVTSYNMYGGSTSFMDANNRAAENHRRMVDEHNRISQQAFQQHQHMFHQQQHMFQQQQFHSMGF